MLRSFVAVGLALLLVVGGLVAAEIKGKVKSYEGDKLTVTADGKDTTAVVTADTKIYKGKEVAKDREKALKALKAGAEVEVTVEKKDGKDVVTEVKFAPKKKKDK